ncbi:MAG: CBS domain-containing protein [Caldilineales bacterium]|nr:CBS domain-containing protein [Caldilineales bacterium]
MALLDGLKHEPLNSFDLTRFCTATSETSVLDVLDSMRKEKRNCTFVVDGNRLVGILTDRDVLRKVVDDASLWEGPVSAIMTPDPLTVGEFDSAADAMQLMHAHKFRNVPVVRANGEVLGNFTYYAVMTMLADTFPVDIYNRPPDPAQVTRRRHGA